MTRARQNTNDNKDIAQQQRVLIIHSGWQTGQAWQPVAAQLADQGHLCWAPTLPTTPPDDPGGQRVTLDQLAAGVLDLIHHDPAMHDLVLVAHSTGGPIAQLVAAAIPERIRAIVFVNAWVMDSWVLDVDLTTRERLGDVLPYDMAALREAADAGQPVTVPPALWHSLFAHDVPADAAGAQPVACPPGWLASTADTAPWWDLMTPGHRPWSVSCLLGADDRALPLETQFLLLHRISPTAVLTVPGGHHAHQADPATVAEALLTVCSLAETTTPSAA
jgi:pimeloyl-ACP methyl ester carboxylesterase